MPRIDDFKMARRLAIESLREAPFKYVVNRSGFRVRDENIIEVPFLGSTYLVYYPDFSFEDASDPVREVPLTEQVLILHYLMARKPLEVDGEWISYREIPGASLYYGPFTARAVTPMVKVFGQRPSVFEQVYEILGGRAIEEGDIGFEYDFFPLVPMRLLLWEGDDEFPPSGNILFDSSIGRILSPEDVAWMSGMIVYKMIAISKAL